MATVVSIPLWNRGKNGLTILITFVIIKFMKAQIVSELTEFIRLTGCSVRRLCLEAGVSPATVSHVLTGRRQDMHSSNADALRAAMLRLSQQPFAEGKDASTASTEARPCPASA